MSPAFLPRMSTVYIYFAVGVVGALFERASGAEPPRLDFTGPVKYPQLIGIVCGVVVFTLTITSVFVLLCKSGSWKKFVSEMSDPNASSLSAIPVEKAAVIPSLCAHPELYENLIEASRSLPIDVDITAMDGRDVTVRLLTAADIQTLFDCCNGKPMYDESAYDPLRLWGWAALNRIGSNGKLEHMDPPVDSLVAFSEYLNSRGRMTNVSIVHSIYKKPIGMISLSSNVPLHLSIEIGKSMTSIIVPIYGVVLVHFIQIMYGSPQHFRVTS